MKGINISDDQIDMIFRALHDNINEETDYYIPYTSPPIIGDQCIDEEGDGGVTDISNEMK